MPTDEELQAAVQAARDEANAEAEVKIKAAANGRFSQDDLDRVAGEARKDGRSVAERELLKSLGFSELEAAKAAIETARTLEDEKKTELQRAQEETARLREEAESAKSEAKTSRIQSSLDIALRDAGINPERAAAAKRLVDLSKLDVNGSEVVGLDEVVKELKGQTPEWFAANFSPPDASGRGTGPVDFGTVSADERDKELAKFGIKI